MPASQHSEPKYMRMKRSRWGRRVIASRKIALSDFFRNGMSSRRKMKWRTLSRFSSTELALSPQIGLLLHARRHVGNRRHVPGNGIPQQAVAEPAGELVGIEEIGRLDAPTELVVA